MGPKDLSEDGNKSGPGMEERPDTDLVEVYGRV